MIKVSINRNTIQNVLSALVAAITVFILMKQCQPKPSVDVQYLPGDSIPYMVYKDKPVPYKITYRDTITSYDTIIKDGDTTYVMEHVDTAAIMRDYHAIVEYSDTVKNDSSALIVIRQKLSRNRIDSMNVRFQNRRKTAVISQRDKALVAGVTGWQNGYDVSLGMRLNRNVLSISRSNSGWGIRYQREIGWKSILEK
jgi:hypothetical protein